MFSAKQASSGRISANSAASPPTSRFSRPSAASFGVRVIGASMKRPPAFATASAIFSVEEGIAVEQSTMRVPGRSDSSRPPAWNRTLSTSGEPVTHRITTSDSAASAAMEGIGRAPAATSASTGWLPGCSRKASGWPCFTMLLAMPWPIIPMPIMPIRLVAAFISGSLPWFCRGWARRRLGPRAKSAL